MGLGLLRTIDGENMTTKSKSDLHRKYADALDLCDKHGIERSFAVRIDEVDFCQYPDFSRHFKAYSFPLAVVENKPVFKGDKLWNIAVGFEFTVTDSPLTLLDKNCSWEKPKPKTFILNGDKHILPTRCSLSEYDPHKISSGIFGIQYYFNDKEHYDNTRNAIVNLLDGKGDL